MQHRRFARRNIGDEAVPLILERNEPPPRQAFGFFAPPPPRNRSEEHHALDQLRTTSGEPAGDDASPRMRDQRNPVHRMLRTNMTNRLLQLSARIAGTAKRR